MAYTQIGNVGSLVLESEASMANPAAVQTLDNIVTLCGDCLLTGYSNGIPFAQLPASSFYPANAVYIPVCVTLDMTMDIAILEIDESGYLYLDVDVSSGTVHMNGLCFNSNSTYYTPEIGNIDPALFTSPLD